MDPRSIVQTEPLSHQPERTRTGEVEGEAAMAASASANELSLETRRTGAHTIVIVNGRVTVDSSPRLRPVLHEAIGAAPPAGVIVDFTATRYLDTSAIATLLEAATLASKRGVPLGVIGLGGEARVVAEATELDHIFLALGYEVQFT
jgi:anti-anti-sigma factor